MSSALPPLAFITGASSGIGQALAQAYLHQGWRVVLVGRRQALMQQWVDVQGPAAARCTVLSADVAEPDSIIAAAQRCLQEQGVPEVVIAAAGISIGMDSAECDDLAVMRETFAINNIGMAATFHPFIQPMRQAGRGALVGIASVAAMRGLPGHGAYCASKAAVVNYCESLRVELRGSGVRVVTILPGFIDTPMTRANPYPMPFLMAADDFARVALRTIARGTRRRVIPWPMGLVAWLLRGLPGAWFDRLMRGRGRKPRRIRTSGPA